jgi:hypothetical protein
MKRFPYLPLILALGVIVGCTTTSNVVMLQTGTLAPGDSPSKSQSWNTDFREFVRKVKNLARVSSGMTAVGKDYGILKKEVAWTMTFKEFSKDNNGIRFALEPYGLKEDPDFFDDSVRFVADENNVDTWETVKPGAEVVISGVVNQMFFAFNETTGKSIMKVTITKVRLIPTIDSN